MAKIWNKEAELAYILQALSKNLNYSEPKFLRSFYIGFCKMVVQELKTHGTVILPELGRFELRVLRKRKWRNPRNGRTEIVGGINQVKFHPTDSLERFFKQLPPQTKNSIEMQMKKLKLTREEAKKLFDN